MSATASLDGHGPDDGLDVDTITPVVHDDISVVDDMVIEDVILDVTTDVPFVEHAPVAEEVLDGFRDPAMPLVILGMISFISLIAIAAFLAL